MFSTGTIEMKKRNGGRPRKKKDTIQPWQFGRAVHVMSAYDESRERGDKHSVAILHAVDLVKRRNPEMPISQTEVKRILAAWRPRGSNTIIRFERSSLSEEDIQKNRWIREQLAMLQEKNGLKLPTPLDYHPARSVAAFTIRFAQRPNYPRHNRKSSE